MASLICFQRSGCAGLFPCARVPGVSAVKGGDPGRLVGLVAFAGGAVPESIFGVAAPGALVESIFGADVPGTPVGATAVAVESLATDLAGESGGMAGIDFTDTASWAGGGGAVTTSFGGRGAGDDAGAGTSLLAMRLEESGGKSVR